MFVTQISVQKEYDKGDNMKPENIKHLREWLQNQAHMPYDHITDLDIILAYHSCNYDIEVTKRVIDLNFTTRTLFSFYQNRVINKSLETALHTWLVTPLDAATKKGYRPVYCQLLDADPDKFVYSDVVKAFGMILDLWQYEEGTIPGLVIILNMANVSLGHISGVDLKVAQEYFYFLQEAMFVRLKGFYFINAPAYMDRLLTMIKPFMNKDMLDLVKVYPVGSNALNDIFPIPALPKDCGGENKNSAILKDEVLTKLKANKHFFEVESKKRVDETQRAEKPKTISSFFPNMEESFKNLEID